MESPSGVCFARLSDALVFNPGGAWPRDVLLEHSEAGILGLKKGAYKGYYKGSRRVL